MKSLLLGTTFMLAGIIGSVSISKADEPGCVPPGAALFRAQAMAQEAGGTAIRLDGDQAEKFLDYINNKVGRHTEYWGDGVIIERFPALDYDSVAVIDDSCVDETKLAHQARSGNDRSRLPSGTVCVRMRQAAAPSRRPEPGSISNRCR